MTTKSLQRHSKTKSKPSLTKQTKQSKRRAMAKRSHNTVSKRTLHLSFKLPIPNSPQLSRKQLTPSSKIVTTSPRRSLTTQRTGFAQRYNQIPKNFAITFQPSHFNPATPFETSLLTTPQFESTPSSIKPSISAPNFTSSRSIRTAANNLGKFYSSNHTSRPDFSSQLATTLSQHVTALPTGTYRPIINIQSRSMASKHEEVGVTPPVQQEDTIFGKMTRDEINVPKVFEDEKCIVINDLHPQAKVHMLVIPRKPISQLSKAEDDDSALLGHLFTVARKVAAERGLADSGYRLVVNNGKEGCQSVYHLHIHVLGGEQLTGNFA